MDKSGCMNETFWDKAYKLSHFDISLKLLGNRSENFSLAKEKFRDWEWTLFTEFSLNEILALSGSEYCLKMGSTVHVQNLSNQNLVNISYAYL
jgi:hypothetical protein